MDAVIEIMYKAVVPWSDTIEKLVQQHLEKEHPKWVVKHKEAIFSLLLFRSKQNAAHHFWHLVQIIYYYTSGFKQTYQNRIVLHKFH